MYSVVATVGCAGRACPELNNFAQHSEQNTLHYPAQIPEGPETQTYIYEQEGLTTAFLRWSNVFLRLSTVAWVVIPA